MSALIIALVVLVLVAIGVVVRLLIAEVSKPAKGTVKIVRKPAGATYRVPASAVAGGVVAGSTAATAASAAAAAQSATVSPASLTMAGPSAVTDGGGGVAVATRPAPAPTPPATTKKPKRQKKMRMRDVVDKGDGVRISFWRRVRSTISLVILVAILGVGAAALVGGFVVFVAFSLEQAIN